MRELMRRAAVSAGSFCCIGVLAAAAGAVRPAPSSAADVPALPAAASGAAATSSAAWLPSAAPAVTLATGQPAADESPAAKACGGLPKFKLSVADEIMAGQLTIAPWHAVTIDPKRDGDINWKMDPFDDPTWTQDFRSGSWIEMLVSGYLAGGPKAAAYRTRAAAITKGWLRAVSVPQRDPTTLICLSQAFPGQAWIQDQIPPTVDYYAAHWMGAWNHGLMQDLKLLRIGCAYPASAFSGAALGWRQTAYAQMVSAFEPNPLGPSIDAQGAVNEQATLYEDFVYNLWHDIGFPLLASCGYQLPSWITARIDELPAFLAYATEPDGDLVQIGDTFVEHPKTDPRQPNLVAVYSAGYVFGRSAWSPGASFYSLRFGPGRQVHGHDDHMGLTYYDLRRDLIVDAGHYGYQNTSYRVWLKSPEAASVLVMPGVPFDAAAPTSLIADDIGSRGQFYELYDTAFSGDPRYRSVYVSTKPDLVLVFDRASGAASYQQLWHLDPALRVTRLSSTAAIAAAPGAKLTLLQIPLPGQVIPAGSTTVVRAQTDPYQGWVSHQMLQRLPADTVEMTRTGPSAAMLTLIVPTAPGVPVSWTMTGPSAGPYLLQVDVGGAVSAFTITAGGAISAS